MKFTEDEFKTVTLSQAYQLGRVDALLGDPPDRFSGKPFADLPVPPGHCGCTEAQLTLWPEIQARYQAGYREQKAQIQSPAIKKQWNQEN